MAQNNTDDLTRVIERYRELIYGLALAETNCRADADDVYQEVFLLYYTKDLVFEDEKARRSWLIRACINISRTCNKSSWYRKRSDDDLDSIPDERSCRTPAQQELWEAVKSLKPKYRTAVYMYYFENIPSAEIAETLGISEDALRTRLSRARKILKEKMRESGYFEKAM
ncbi:RNA polymerase sigma-70 factor, ECF subfamily [Ruminococcus sp. YE71]|uniref:RNA polymerase sigma factor n=1 Tax=unclassified Ruminococcus TaxID=2608920 RepID=UPI000888AE9F|nr:MULTISPECIES: sigma-70 family RNA polymerase sigma factor [unclassified Ruminococcus]SDA29850.1 RNA polymerase sigma-70 factor, ECF subfamily [Ruminococcus sp. YE78]SFW48955.1 RNA polymerase sigma-70 factor, ECF subfamily [Ruminococcus sp. YE71]